jgi:protein-tyrosine phosphatase
MTEALEMARIAVSDGITVIACTPHITPGLYDNAGASIRDAVAQLAIALEKDGISLRLVAGADVYLAPNLEEGMKVGRVPTLANSRYFLLELPHHVLPPRFEETIFSLIDAGYAPILTHPERLSWIESRFDVVERLWAAGVWLQLTAGSLTGSFGRRARYWAERMLSEGMVQILATDAHNTGDRPPRLAEARDIAATRCGNDEAERLVWSRPLAILDNLPPCEGIIVGAA